MFNLQDTEKRNYDILWDQFIIFPSIQLKFGIKRKILPLTRQYTKKRGTIYYINNFVELSGKWENIIDFGSLLSLKLKNISDSSIKLTRLVFPAENGLENFLKDFKPQNISFFRNGYQSWSTSRSYKLKDKPLRPWLQLVSLTSSNLANLPSNTPGNLSSEMYSIVTDLESGKSFLVGQSMPFNDFFYIRLHIQSITKKTNHFELVYDFGRKMINPGETIQLDGIIMALGTSDSLQMNYFSYIKKEMGHKNFSKNIKGWSSWYCYYNKITPELIYKNIKILKERNINSDYIQVDDGYQKCVGDWLELSPNFNGRMKEISDTINEAGFKPGIWIAPFIADKKSELANIHPDYILRDDYGKPLTCGYNPQWRGKFYYGLDVTNPRVEEYIRKIIRTIIHQWGFKYLKLDFLFGACLRGANHHELKYSRAEMLKYGIRFIREEAGRDVVLLGCGMPMSAGIGLVNAMRVGPDTSPYWNKLSGIFLQTGAMTGMKNSIRNFMARSLMNKFLWLNDPDCLMLRKKKIKLTMEQRQSQINAIIISGAMLFFSDDLSDLSPEIFEEIHKINELSDFCFKGNAIPLDLMERGIPELYYNTNGFIGIFNFKDSSTDKRVDFRNYTIFDKKILKLQDVWTNEEINLSTEQAVFLKNMRPCSSRLFRIYWGQS